jgi:hypothetical protein
VIFSDELQFAWNPQYILIYLELMNLMMNNIVPVRHSTAF